MAAVSETIVREFFELHGLLVRQQRKYVTPSRRDGDQIDFFVINPQPEAEPGALPFTLTPSDLGKITRAVVAVKGWHTGTFSSAFLSSAPEVLRFVEPAIFQRASRVFCPGQPITKILILPALPQSAEAKGQAIEFLRGKGVDAVIPFETILSNLIDLIEVNRNYLKSDLLQTIRIFKNYNFFREPQLELFKPKTRRRKRAPAGGA